MPARFLAITSMSDVIYTSKPVGGSAIDNSIPNATFTRQELAAWMNADPHNAISYAISRNPTTVYKFIRQNYGDAYPNLKEGAQATYGQMEGMEKFLDRQYNNMNEAQQKHLIVMLLQSLPKMAELQNWTTPVSAQQ